tara:strand:+ start:204 stop:1157 length:954 start_codon:yes stop_codon:yes gene_type:complete
MATSTFDFIVRDAASTAAGGGGDGSVPKDDTSSVMKENNALTRKGLQQNLGIQLSVAAVLKQSQLFTGFVGAIFQILGGGIDMLLGPLAPILKSFLNLGIKFLPIIQKVSEGIAAVIDALLGVGKNIVDRFNNLSDSVDNFVKNTLGIGSEGSTAGVGAFRATRFNPNKGLLAMDDGAPKPKGLLGSFPGSKLIGGLLRKAGLVGLAAELFGASAEVIEAGQEGGVSSFFGEAGIQGAEIGGAFAAFSAGALAGGAAGGPFAPITALVGGIVGSIAYEFAGRNIVGGVVKEVLEVVGLESTQRQAQDNTARMGNGAY